VPLNAFFHCRDNRFLQGCPELFSLFHYIWSKKMLVLKRVLADYHMVLFGLTMNKDHDVAAKRLLADITEDTLWQAALEVRDSGKPLQKDIQIRGGIYFPSFYDFVKDVFDPRLSALESKCAKEHVSLSLSFPDTYPEYPTRGPIVHADIAPMGCRV
jgi:hypothetical protein